MSPRTGFHIAGRSLELFQGHTCLTDIGQRNGANTDVGFDAGGRVVNHRWEAFSPGSTPLGQGTLVEGYEMQSGEATPAPRYDRAGNRLIEYKTLDPGNTETQTSDRAMNPRQDHPLVRKARLTRERPTRRPERDLARRVGGGALIAGVDEAGRGPLAGPVVAAAVIWPDNLRTPRGLNDSKQVDPLRRRELFGEIVARAQAAAVGVATAREIDRINILEATRLAARRALDALPAQPHAVITDYLLLPGYPAPVEPIVKGDCLSVCVAAASIIAKVIRDRMMDHYSAEYPGYGWETNRGYATPDHIAALDQLGPCTLHRLTFAGVGFFTQLLRPSRTFQRVWSGAPDAASLVKPSRADNLCRASSAVSTRAWALGNRHAPEELDRVADLLTFTLDPRVGVPSAETQFLLLDEQELDALGHRMQNTEYIPPWLP